jgi:acetylornithine deacetylase/succinyl-diaminopimelate desuccinylase-like protein
MVIHLRAGLEAKVVSNNPNHIQYLKQHVIALGGKIGERHIKKAEALHRAADYISDQLASMGYKVENQEYRVKGVTSANLEARLPGCNQEEKTIVIGAHYDTAKNCPGANDNATGIAVLLEIARILKTTKPHHNFRFAAFTNEAPPFFGTEHMGSWHYAHEASQNGDKIEVAIILESLGYYSNDQDSQLYPPFFKLLYPDKGNFLAMVSNLHSMKTMHRFNNAFRKHSKLPSCRMTALNLIRASTIHFG